MSRIANELTLAAPAEFLKRPDGLPGLSQKYHLNFAKIVQMQTNLVYQAIKHDKVQVVEVFTTDGLAPEFQLRLLRDDLHFYPPYYAAPIVRNLILKKYPQIAFALVPLAGRLDNKTMRHLNYQVDVKKISPEKVAHDFLVDQKLI